MSGPYPVERFWEIRRVGFGWAATWCEEIPLKPGRAVEDTMPKIELLGEVFPWTLSTFTRWGLERRLRRWARKGYDGEWRGLPA